MITKTLSGGSAPHQGFLESSITGKYGVMSKRALPVPVNYENQEESDQDSDGEPGVRGSKKKDVLVLVKKHQARGEYNGYTNGDSIRLQLIGQRSQIDYAQRSPSPNLDLVSVQHDFASRGLGGQTPYQETVQSSSRTTNKNKHYLLHLKPRQL
jgi:hypothetical protein